MSCTISAILLCAHRGLHLQDNKTKSMDIVATDYFSPSAFPVTASTLESAFASANRLKDLTSLYVSSIVYPLAPDLTKSGSSVQGAGDVDDTRLQEDRQRRGIYPDPLAAGPPPRGPFGGMPQQPPPPGGIGGVGPIPPVGRSDLDPLAGMGGTTTGRIPLGGGDGDGMMLGPNHPLFRDRFNGPQPAAPFGGGIGGPPMGPLGSDGFLPPGAVPPGARFDPIVPGPAGRFGPRPGGGPGPVRRGDPDNDEFMPPVSLCVFLREVKRCSSCVLGVCSATATTTACSCKASEVDRVQQGV